MTGLRHGYLLADIDSIARSAARNAGSYASDYTERYDDAYSAAVQALYTAEHPPTEHELFAAARSGVWRALHASEHVRGLVPDRAGGTRTMAAYERYWHATSPPSPEQVVLDPLATRQIWPRLTALHQDTLLAYAAHDCSIIATATALQVPYKTMSARIDYARARFLALWHEGEAPSRKWRKEGARRPDERLVRCGTQSAYYRHWHRGEPIDDACRRAQAAAGRAYRRAKANRAATFDLRLPTATGGEHRD